VGDGLPELGDGFAERVTLRFQRAHLGLELEDPAHGGQRHPLADQVDDVPHDGDLVPRVAALAALRPRRTDHPVLVQPAQEGLLDLQHVRYLADGEQRQVLVIHGQ